VALKLAKDEDTTLEQLREHYRIEIELANRLRTALPDERRRLYSVLYDEFYRRVPKRHAEETRREVSRQMNFLRRFLNKDLLFVEVGPGDCALSFVVAPFVKKVFAVDVSKEVSTTSSHPENFQLIISDGRSIPLKGSEIDIVYSYHLMEHIHPDDAIVQLGNIYQILTQGGIYICVTPNRLNGPHDVSKYFDEVALGFHLKEYTTSELVDLFRTVGFVRVKAYLGLRGVFLPIPLIIIQLIEGFVSIAPRVVRSAFRKYRLLRVLLGIRLVGIK
jgi:SAM-dependent methyltransferase